MSLLAAQLGSCWELLEALACPGSFHPNLLSSHLADNLFYFLDHQIWAQYEEATIEDVVTVPEEKERTATYKPVFVTEITDDLHFYVQDVETGKRCNTDAPGKSWANQ